MTMDDNVKKVEALIAKAVEAKTADDALKFSQAACNTANALCAAVHALKEV
jgi:hypothetical protein